VILHGGDVERRRAAALELARGLLCSGREGEESCRRRVVWPDDPSGRFHPDFHVLERDLKTATSVEATKKVLLQAQVSPFEAGAQVFVVTAAETLSPEAANALLKTLEEPHLTAPRHFFLLVPSQFDLLPTLRSRSLAVFLGGGGRPDAGGVEMAAAAFSTALDAWIEQGSVADLLVAATALGDHVDFGDASAGEPWTVAAAAVLEAARRPGVEGGVRRSLLDLADDLLGSRPLRLRGIPARRILEGKINRWLVPVSRQRLAAPGAGR
jgi:hypothetical protein